MVLVAMATDFHSKFPNAPIWLKFVFKGYNDQPIYILRFRANLKIAIVMETDLPANFQKRHIWMKFVFQGEGENDMLNLNFEVSRLCAHGKWLV